VFTRSLCMLFVGNTCPILIISWNLFWIPGATRFGSTQPRENNRADTWKTK
jgi:hypothetical protein